MKIEKIITTTQTEDIEISEVTLLSDEEYLAYRDNIPNIFNTWWLKTSGEADECVKVVWADGGLDDVGRNVTNRFGIRPCLKLTLKQSDLKVGDKFMFGDVNWTMISGDIALCDVMLTNMLFKANYMIKSASSYRHSDAKKFLDEWASEKGFTK